MDCSCLDNCWIYLVTAKLCAIIAILKGIISYKSSRCEVIGPKPSNPVSRGFPSKVVGMISPQVCRFPHRTGKCDVKQTTKTLSKYIGHIFPERGSVEKISSGIQQHLKDKTFQ